MQNSDDIQFRARLYEAARAGCLYALLDSGFDAPTGGSYRRLELRDTDPILYEKIAWHRVSYSPPQLVAVNGEGLQWFLSAMPAERWGIFIIYRNGIENLARHLQRFVIVKGPDEMPYFLRFQDASVVECLLQTWSEFERQIFWGEIDALAFSELNDLTWKIIDNPLGPEDRRVVPPEQCLLTLSAQQILDCSDRIEKDIRDLIYWYLRADHHKSVQFIPRDILLDRIQVGVERARGYQLTHLMDLAGFVALMMELSPTFDEHPTFHRVLVDPRGPRDFRIQRLTEVITEKEWREAASLYDQNFWRIHRVPKWKVGA